MQEASDCEVSFTITQLRTKAELRRVVVYPTPSEGWGVAEGHGAPEAGQLSWCGPEVVERQRVAKESVAGLCRMICCSKGAAAKILDSANPRDKNLKEGCVHCSEDERENTASMTREHKFLSGNRANLRVEEFR